MTDSNGANGGRDSHGRFRGGNPGGPGRPRGFDFRRIVQEQAESHGYDLETAMWEVFLALMKKAQKGNVPAAKVLLDRLCQHDPVKIEMSQTTLTDEERLTRIRQLLAVAKARSAEASAAELALIENT